MRKGRLLVTGLVGVTAWLPMPAADAATTGLKATLDAAEEVPAPGPAGGKGTAAIKVDDAANTVCYELSWEGIGEPSAAHIHTGAKGVAGPVAVDLELRPDRPAHCVKGDPTMVAAIRDDPGGHYVNIHTKDYRAGAIRGQLEKG